MLEPNRSLTFSASGALGQALLAIAVGALAVTTSAYAVVSPDPLLLTLLYLVIALSLASALTPQLFIAASILVFAISTAASAPVFQSGAAVYVSDVLVALIAFRGALPRDRVPPSRALTGLPTVLFAAWAFVMVIAALRGMNAGVELVSVVRGEVALVYWPLLYFGYTRILRERALRTSLLWRNLAYVALGLATWMFVARVLDLPFDDPGLGRVPTGDGQEVLRNFGFAGAFVVYPLLALAGISGMAHGGERRRQWIFLATIGTTATLLTLVRGGILALALGALVVLMLRPRVVGRSSRVGTVIQLGLAIVTVGVGLIAVNPELGHAVVQRAIPLTDQAEEAEANAEYRQEAVEAGLEAARSHPLGLGVLDVARLDAEQIDKNYLAHSGVATLLLFGGWPALLTALALILALLWRSSQLPAPTPWLHPMFVGALTLLTVYSVGAAGLAGDTWVIPLGALAVALRFALASQGTAGPLTYSERASRRLG
ncbi:MAG: O-antigen ligase family protein [Gaiellaceae bacterium]